MKRLTKNPFLLGGALTLALPAYGQMVLEEVIVTAQKRDESQQEVPIAMNAFSAEDVKNRQIASVADLAVTVPSLRIGEAIGAQQISLRGVGYGLFSGAGENAVAVHVDGIYLANPGSVQLLQHDVAGVEVLRGPQGTLWGRNATGGVINFITPSPSDEFGGSLKVGAGNYGAVSASGNVNIPISDVLSVRGSIDYLDRDGYLENRHTGNDIAGVEKISGRVAIRFTPSDQFQADLKIFSGEEDWGGPYFSATGDSLLASPFGALNPQFDDDPRKLYANIDPLQESSLHGASLRLQYDFGSNISLVSLTGFVDYQRELLYDNDGSSLNMTIVGRDINDKTISQEFNLSGDHGDLNWLVGAYYLKQDADVFSDAPLNDFVYMSGLTQLLFDFEEEVESEAVFFDVTYAFTEQLSVYGGLRALWEDREGTFSQTLIADLGALPFLAFQQAGPGANPADFGLTMGDLVDVGTNGFGNYLTGIPVALPACSSPVVENKSDVSKTTGRLGVKYQFNDSVMGYAQFSTGYKSGGFASSACDDPFKPENLDAYEIGFKSEMAGGRVRINGAVYYYDYSDLQVEQGLGTSIVVENADAEIKGLDLDVLFVATDQLLLSAAVALIDSEYTKFVNIDSIDHPTLLQDVSGNPLLRAPEWSFVAGAQYDMPLADGANLILRTDLLFSDSYQTREFNNPADKQPSYHNVNAIASYTSASETWAFSMWVKNLTDEEVLQNSVEVSTLVGTGAYGVRGTTYNLPRMFGADIEFRF